MEVQSIDPRRIGPYTNRLSILKITNYAWIEQKKTFRLILTIIAIFAAITDGFAHTMSINFVSTSQAFVVDEMLVLGQIKENEQKTVVYLNDLTNYNLYDSLERLKNVKRKDKNILKSNQYHYYNN